MTTTLDRSPVDRTTLELERWAQRVGTDPAGALTAARDVLLRELDRSLLAESEAVAVWPDPPAACRSALQLAWTRARVRAAENVLRLCEAKIRSDSKLRQCHEGPLACAFHRPALFPGQVFEVEPVESEP